MKTLYSVLIFLSVSAFSVAQTYAPHGPYYVGPFMDAIYGKNNRLIVSADAGGVWYTDDRQTWKKPTTYVEFADHFIFDDAGALYTYNFRGNIFKSTDNGETWISLFTFFLNDNDGPAVSYDRVNDIGLAGDTVFMAHNNGLGWFKQSVDPPGHLIHKFDGKSITAIAVDHKKIVVADPDDITKFYYSLDRGETWDEKEVPFDKGTKNIIIAGDRIWVDDYDVWYSDNWGDTWEKKDEGLSPVSVVKLDWSGDKMYVHTDGIYVFSNDEDKWIRLTDDTDFLSTTLATKGQQIFAADEATTLIDSHTPTDYGHFKESNDGGDTWNEIPLTGYTNNVILSLAADSEGNVYGSTNNNFLIRKKKDEELFKLFDVMGYATVLIENDIVYASGEGQLKAYNSKTGEPVELNTPYSSDLSGSNHLAKAGKYFYTATSSSIWRVADGEDYELFSTGLSTVGYVRTLRISGGNIFLVTDKGVFRSGLDTPDWKKIYPSSGDRDVVALGLNGSTVVVSGAVSHDNGDTWQDIDAQFYDILHQDDEFIGVTFSKIYVSKDDGNTWVPVDFANDFPFFGWAITRTDDDIYIGTEGNGVVSIPKSELETEVELVTGLEEKPDDLAKVYPNPARDEINVVTPIEGYVELMDMFGSVLTNRRVSIATPESFDVGHLSKGVYFFRMNMNGQVVIKKFVKQ